MTPLALIYFLVGLVALFWPLVIVLHKRQVLGVQWLMTATMILFGLSAIIFSTFFNTFLVGEYLMVMLYMVLSLSVPPLAVTSAVALTDVRGVSRLARSLAYPSIAVVLLMALSVIIGGADMYRLWIERGTFAGADQFYAGSWRYNLIVSVHYYLYWFVLVAEVLSVNGVLLYRFIRYRKTLGEYYTNDPVTHKRAVIIFISVTLVCLSVVTMYLFYPFNMPRPLWFAILTSAIIAAAILVVGFYTYSLSYGAERLSANIRSHSVARSNSPASISRRVSEYVEWEKGFLDPDLSVFVLAERLNISQDDVVDAIHRLHGTPFSTYIDGLRVEHAVGLLLHRSNFNADDPEQVAVLAHQCGYLTAEALQHAFSRVMDKSLKQWTNQ